MNMLASLTARRTAQVQHFCNFVKHISIVPGPSESFLHYEELVIPPAKESNFTSSPRLVVILHGLLGSGRNWRSFARLLGKQIGEHPVSANDERGWRFLLFDQRNHGQSTSRGHPGPHTLGASARDLQKALHGATPDILIGHSMGGKVALEYLRQLGLGGGTSLSSVTSSSSDDSDESDAELAGGGSLPLPGHTWVLDSVPWEVKGDPHQAKQTLNTLKQLPQPVPSRQWLNKHMSERGYEQALIDWVGISLVEAPGTAKGTNGPLVWSFDVKGCEDMYNSYQDNCLMGVLRAPNSKAPRSLVLGEKSASYPEGIARLKEMDIIHDDLAIHTLKNAGHWVQVENPKGLAEIMMPSFINALKDD